MGRQDSPSPGRRNAPMPQKGAINLQKLEKQRAKLKSQGASTDDIDKQIMAVNEWFTAFKQHCSLTEGELKKKLRTDLHEMHKIARDLSDMRESMKLEMPNENDKRQLDRARRWSQLLVECEIILKDKTQTEVDFDRIYDIKGELERMKALDDFTIIKDVKAQFAMIDEWHEELDKVTESDEEGRVINVDRDLLKTLINKARKEFKINISQEIDEIESQFEVVEIWEKSVRQLTTSEDYEKIDEAKRLLVTVREDKEENYNIIDKNLFKKLQIWHLTATCRESIKKKRMAIEFIKIMEKELKLMNSHMHLQLEETKEQRDASIQSELELLEMARRYHQQTQKQTTDKPPARVLTFEDVEMIIGKSDEVPFEVDKKFIESLKKEVALYQKDFVKQIDKMFGKCPDIAEYDEVMAKMKESLSFISPHEQLIETMREDYNFIMAKVKQYPELKADKKNDDEDDEGAKVPRFVSDFKEITEKSKELKCKCLDAERLIHEYKTALKLFNGLKESFEKAKLEMALNFTNLAEFNEKLMHVSLDFENDELNFREEIWHERIALLIKELKSGKNFSQSERISCELVRFWLEEGQELEVVNDQKYEQLSELVEDLDHISRALKMCNTIQEVDQLDKQEHQGKLIDFEHLIVLSKTRISRGELQKRTQLTCSPIEFLKNLRNKHATENERSSHSKRKSKSTDKDGDMDESASPSGDEGAEDDVDTELEDEGKDDTAVDKKLKDPSKKSRKQKDTSGEPAKKRQKKQVEKKESILAPKLIKKPILNKTKEPAKDGVEEKKSPEKPSIKGLGGGGLKLGGSALQKPLKGILKKTTITPPKKQIQLSQSDKKTDQDVEMTDQVKKNEIDTEASDNGVDKIGSLSQDTKKPLIPVKRPASELLKKDLIKKPIIESLPKKEESAVKVKPEKKKPAEPKAKKESKKAEPSAAAEKQEKPSEPIKKAIMPIKKAVGGGGGGLAASLAKIKS
ncbi:hypothetical protein FGO68_gene805 [Halteria grandinella]|uniref:Uncharacterized protein n=1 Tax=Halteria grandinella TaxID=5974 RepID=A0A8J8T7P9_HALGN|nr:hypothetical protein FGO68_gene805 [Halteria grandinella]